MNNEFKLPFSSFDWSNIQKQFMEALLHNSGKANAFAGQSSNVENANWADAMNLWWQVFKPEATAKNENVFAKILEQCRAYYILGEQFAKILDGMQKSKESADNYMHLLDEQLHNIANVFTDNNLFFSNSNFINKYAQQAELLKNILADSSPLTSNSINEYSSELRKLRERFLSAPGLGYSRETQEKWQEMLRLLGIYQDNCQEFQTVMSRLHHATMELLRKRLLQMYKEGESIESMRQIYNLWVESGEKVYADFAFTKEFAELNSRLVNSLMAVKSKGQEITEDYLESMNLPTSSAIATLERRQYDLRKQVRSMESELRTIRSELFMQKQAPSAKAKKTVVQDKSVATEQQATVPVNKKNTTRKRQPKKAAEKRSSAAVTFNQTQLKKKKVNSTKSKRRQDKKNSADSKRMIEIKF